MAGHMTWEWTIQATVIFSDRMGGDMMQRTKREDRRLFILGYNRAARSREACTDARISVFDGDVFFWPWNDTLQRR